MARTELYRHFNKAGELLYVGISTATVVRLLGHRHNSPWFNSITTITIERFATREEAEKAECAAILNECPKYNIARSRHIIGHRGRVRQANIPKTLLGARDYAKRLAISRRTVYYQLERGGIAVKPIEGSKPPKWRAAEVDAYLIGSGGADAGL